MGIMKKCRKGMAAILSVAMVLGMMPGMSDNVTRVQADDTSTIILHDVDLSGDISKGDIVDVGEESFYVTGFDDTNITCFAVKGISIKENRQSDNPDWVRFSESAYSTYNNSEVKKYVDDYGTMFNETYGLDASAGLVWYKDIGCPNPYSTSANIYSERTWYQNGYYWTSSNYRSDWFRGVWLVNGNQLLAVEGNSNTAMIRPSITFARSKIEKTVKDITSVTIIDIDAPMVGKALDTNASSETEGVQNIEVAWKSDHEISEEEKISAKYNASYTSEITIRAKDGYMFTSSTCVIINEEECSGEIKDNGKTLVATYTFPATSKDKLLSITAPSDITMDNGAAYSDIVAKLPTKVDITTEGCTVAEADVTWDQDFPESGSYDSSVLKGQNVTFNGTVTCPETIDQNNVDLATTINVIIRKAGTVYAPTANVKAGTYTSEQIVVLTTSTDDATIYYTTDGTEPAVDNDGKVTGTTKEYSEEAISVKGTQGKSEVTTIKAIAVKPGMYSSPVATFEYEIEIPHTHGFAGAEWTTDANNHWKKCNVENCNQREGYLTDKKEHSFTYIYVWSDDYKTCIATRTCSVCGYNDFQTVDSTSKVTQNKTCTLPEKTTYTATFTNGAEVQTKVIDTAQSTGHNMSSCKSNGNGTHTRICQNTSCLDTGRYTQTEKCAGGTATYFKKAVCTDCGAEYDDYANDTTAPTGNIKVSSNTWSSLLNTVTFGHFFKETQRVTITGTDDSYTAYGYDSATDSVKIEYMLVSGNDTKAYTSETLKAEYEADKFIMYNKAFNIDPDNKYVVFARIEDHAGNVTYISSDGMVLDGTAPVISGLKDKETYCGGVEFTAKDANLDNVTDTIGTVTKTLEASNGKYTVTVGTHKIIATDKAGNNTSYTITVNEDHSYSEPTYTWNDNHTECTAKRICLVCKNEETETAKNSKVTSKIEQEKTCTLPELTTYTAKFINGAFKTQIAENVETAKAEGHTWNEDYIIDKAATCTEAGSKSIHCKNCNETKDLKEIDALGHDFAGDWTITKDVTCTENGNKTRKCSRCDEPETKIIKATGHTEETDAAVAATCTEEGKTAGSHCLVCNTVIKAQETVPATGHLHTEVRNEKEATYDKEGYTGDTYCTDCDTKLSSGKVIEKRTKPTDDSEKEPLIGNKTGWEEIKADVINQIKNATATSEKITITIDMNTTSKIDGGVLDAIKGKNVDVVLDMGDGIAWTINGNSVISDSVADIDLGVNKNSDMIPVDIINTVTGERSSIQISLVHNGEFGFTATLSIGLEAKNAGYYANLFYYNADAGKLEFMNAAKIDEEGNASLTFSHASDYSIVIADKIMDGNKDVEDDTSKDDISKDDKSDDGTGKKEENDKNIIDKGTDKKDVVDKDVSNKATANKVANATTTSDTSTKSSAKTGDNSLILLWVLVMIGAGSGVIAVAAKRRRQR